MSPNLRRAVCLAGPLMVGAGMLLLAAGCTQKAPGPPGDAQQPPAGHGGRVRGTVTLRGDAPLPQAEPNDKDAGVCGSSVPVTRLSLGPNRAVRQAFVYLEGVFTADVPRPRASTQVQQERCEYGPHVTTMPVGSDLEIVNNDPVLHNVHARTATPTGLQTVFNIAQPVRGQRTKLESLLTKPGIVGLTCEAGHPWMTAYIFVAAHPFVTTTDANGEFVIDGVPPGTYPIKMWHEGVRLTRVVPSLQQYEYEPHYEAVQDVVVPAGGEAVVNFALELRPLE